MSTTLKKEMLGVKVDPEVKEKLKAKADELGIDLSDHVRAILAASLGRDPMKDLLAEAMVTILACQSRSVSTEQAIKLVKDLFIAGAFKEDLQ